MAKVILHIGDTVTHSTLGEGVVTIVDDEFVSIKFATDELTFRLPDAFENGLLISDDAQFIEDPEDENSKRSLDYEESLEKLHSIAAGIKAVKGSLALVLEDEDDDTNVEIIENSIDALDEALENLKTGIEQMDA